MRNHFTTPSGAPSRALLPALALVAGSTLFPPAANAQNALGDGTALDNSLRLGERINPMSPNANLAAEVAYRNALVTGNVGGGMSFREGVGYTSAFDFRTEYDASGNPIPLPSNEIFNFERDSASSATLRGIDGLRTQAVWSIGGAWDQSANLPIFRRAGVGASAALPYGEDDELYAQQLESSFIDPFRLRPGSLRSTTEHTVGSALETRILGQVQDEETQRTEYLQATPLRGVVAEPVLTEKLIQLFDGKAIGAPNLVSSYLSEDPAPDADDAEFGYDAVVRRMSEQFHERYAPAEEDEVDGAPTRPGDSPAIDPSLDPSAEDGAADEPSGRSQLADPLQRLRDRLLGLPTDEEEADAETDDGMPEALRKLYRDTRGEDKIERLSPPIPHNRNLFAENMRTGEDLLSKGRWFDAEERFGAALRLSPGDPMAAVGRLHAQIGAGLYLSAGVNLDRLFRSNPELIAARYDENLLPRRGRLDRIDNRLRLNTRRNSDLAISSSLLMAYLGHQFEDRATVVDAFAALDRIHEERGDSPDELEETLRAVWLGD